MKKFFYQLIIFLCFNLFLNVNTFGSFESRWLEDDVIVSNQKKFIEAIDKAEKYILLGTYKIHDHLLPDREFLDALESAVHRGVKIMLMIEKNLTDPEKKEGNESIKPGDALAVYQNLGVQLISCPQLFGASHIKVLVADDLYSIVGTTNFDKKFDEQKDVVTRDFAILMTNSEIITELKNVLLADAENKVITLPNYKVSDMTSLYKLTWGPEQQRQHFLEMIDYAKKSIEIYQQDLQDPEIVNHLVTASKKGLTIRILMSEYPFGKKHGNKNKLSQQMISDAGGQVKLTSVPPLHIHAKVLIIDDTLMYVGSCNFFPHSIDEDRQVGLITRDKKHLNRFLEVFEKDWQDTH